MPWRNITVFVPPGNDTVLTELLQEARTNGCWLEPRYCPRVRPFLQHHVVKASNFPAEKKVRTMGGNKIWWTMVGDDKFLMPEGIKVGEIEQAENGERWHIATSLDY